MKRIVSFNGYYMPVHQRLVTQQICL